MTINPAYRIAEVEYASTRSLQRPGLAGRKTSTTSPFALALRSPNPSQDNFEPTAFLTSTW